MNVYSRAFSNFSALILSVVVLALIGGGVYYFACTNGAPGESTATSICESLPGGSGYAVQVYLNGAGKVGGFIASARGVLGASQYNYDPTGGKVSEVEPVPTYLNSAEGKSAIKWQQQLIAGYPNTKTYVCDTLAHATTTAVVDTNSLPPDVYTDFPRLLIDLKENFNIDAPFPSVLPFGSNRTVYFEYMVSPASYTIQFARTPTCFMRDDTNLLLSAAASCESGTIVVTPSPDLVYGDAHQRLSNLSLPNTVALGYGVTGYYAKLRCNQFCTQPSIEWVQRGADYLLEHMEVGNDYQALIDFARETVMNIHTQSL